MTTVRDIYNALFAFAPASMKMDWDNVGLLCGRFDGPKRRSPRSICTRISTSAPAGSTTYWQKHWG